MPREKVVEHFSNRDNQPKWFDDLKSVEVVEGVAGETGSKSLLTYNSFELHETVLENRLPDEFVGDYLTKGTCRNKMKSSFHQIDENRTRYDVEVTDYEFYGLMVKVMAFVMPGAFKKQVNNYLARFKEVVEIESKSSG